MAERIPRAQPVELSGPDHLLWLTDTEAIVGEIEEFLTAVRRGPEADRVLATVLFTDIVGASEIDTAGDGFLATFDGPARAVRCVCSISDSVHSLRIEVRAGLHTGKCETMGDKLGGIAVHTGSRVAALAGAGEVLGSSTVKDLVAGSGLSFQDRGVHSLKGIPGEWNLFAAER